MSCSLYLYKTIRKASAFISRSPVQIVYHRRWFTTLEIGQDMSSAVSPFISITFLSSGNILTPQKSLVIVTAHNNYLINAPEGLSRVLQESSAKHSKISHIFVTGNQWELFGGLIGTCLNIHGSGLQSAVTLHGPPVIKEVGNLMTKFSDSVGMKLAYNESTEITDSVFNISSLNVCSKSGDPAQSFCYLFKPIPAPAKLDLLKALKMNFPVAMLKDGVTAHRLKAGESVALPDGRVIDGKQLLIHPAQARSVLILDCATPDLAEQLAACQQLRRWIADPDGIDLAVHLADPALLRTDQYRAIVDLFAGSGVRHAVLDDRCGTPALYGACQAQLMLNSLHCGLFPLLHGHKFMADGEVDTQQRSDVVSAAGGSSSSFPDNATSCEVHQEYHVRPPAGFEPATSSGQAPSASNRPQREPFTEAALREKLFEDNELYISRDEFARRMAAFAAERATWPGFEPPRAGAVRPFPWVQFLGTASSNPIKYRNVSAIMLHISQDTTLLLDCGEGTLFQLINFYGPEAVQAVLRSIKAVCISHMHLDHQSGVFSLLMARREAFTRAGLSPEPCAFVGPRGFQRWLEFFATHDICGLSHVLSAGQLDFYWSEIVSRTVQWNNAEAVCSRFEAFVKEVLHLNKLSVVPVQHSTKVAFGFAIQGTRSVDGSKGATTPWKIVYSGDTVPCASLVQAGMGCDLLIHEATFQDGLESEAGAKMHSTVGQAVNQGVAMRAAHTLLTHFSARYSCAVPALHPESCGAGFAYDHMCVTLPDLPHLPRLAAMLQCIFPKHFDELEKRCVRLRRQQPPRAAPAAEVPSGAVKRSSPGKRRKIDGQP